ncbi:Cell wall-active antibiotics response 4TMS YvqF [Actinomadura glauciflava]|nr:Cell wall-active antibiotics response 4TMS YvqF [Actinomadura glauciflava]
MRAGDADRERVAQVLRDAAGEGRLTLDELDERLDAVYAAKTYAELEPITRDLPSPGRAASPATGADWRPVQGAPSWRSGIGIMSGFRRAGVWNVPRRFRAFAFWGGGKIDLREARFEEGQVVIRALAIMGGFEIIVPDDITVHVNGLGIMGGFDQRASGPGVPGSPTVVVKGLAFWGGVAVKRRARRKAEH